MALQQKTLNLIEQAHDILKEHNPMTLRQVYYQLVARHVIDNKRSEYQKLSKALVKARQDGIIPWNWIEDRVRKPQKVSMWQDVTDFIETVKHAYRKDIWNNQPRYIEVWLEKDALSGVFTDITKDYGVTLVVGRGYNSWSAYKEASKRFNRMNMPVKILYFGDFDPSGEDIVRALEESLNFFGTSLEIEKVSLTMQDIKQYKLPPDFTKKRDTRSAAFVEKYGDLAVELDALPLPVLQQNIKESLENELDMEALIQTQEEEREEREELEALL